ncbi:hypothetical protein [Listeria sp. PSOL-1]|uniref:hypothetical protein n=1 Tax=Listeria sp. PSOL-1 TaxID=1844999 RepID=UPI0013D01DB4|nr:hypothetical protein [Listeria sp. PSOL-1]
MKFFISRFLNRKLLLAFLIGMMIMLLHIIKIYILSQKHEIIFTPYTSWLSIDFTSVLMILFYLLLPLLACFGTASVFLEDMTSELFAYSLTSFVRKTLFTKLFITVFVISALVTTIPLLLDFFLSFLFLPNIAPDKIINLNLGIYLGSGDLFPRLFYAHPFGYAMLHLFLCFIFSGVFGVMSLAVTFLSRNKIIIILVPLFVQVVLIALNTFAFPLFAFSPFGFLPESMVTYDKNIIVIAVVWGLLFFSSLVIFVRGARRYEQL